MRVYVKTPARLHLGLIDLGGELGRIFGSLGVAVKHPNVVLEAYPSEGLTISGQEKGRVRSLVERFLRFYPTEAKVQIHVHQTIPEHVGLGSGTQLSLAVATVLAKFLGIKASVRELASIMGRGSVSGIGTAIFEHGGFILDGGNKMDKGSLSQLPSSKGLPPIIFRYPFPEDWLFVVVIPNVKRGLTAEEEVRAFERLSPAPPDAVGRVCRLVLMRLLPSLVEEDIQGFGEALTQVQKIVGDYFKEAQGGRYGSPVAEECLEHMLNMGAYGVGQSSWGPAIYGLVEGREKAEGLKQTVEGFLREEGVGGQVFYTGANNRGAQVKVTKD